MPTLTVKTDLYTSTNRTRSLVASTQRGVSVTSLVTLSGVLAAGETLSHAQPFGFLHLQTTRPVLLRFNPQKPYELTTGLWETLCNYYFVATVEADAIEIVAKEWPVSYTAHFAVLAKEVLQ